MVESVVGEEDMSPNFIAEADVECAEEGADPLTSVFARLSSFASTYSVGLGS